MSHRILFRSMLMAAMVGVSTLCVAGVGIAAPKHPRMHAALHELKESRVELKEAAHDFGGHREKALKAADHAIEQLELALKFARA